MARDTTNTPQFLDDEGNAISATAAKAQNGKAITDAMKGNTSGKKKTSGKTDDSSAGTSTDYDFDIGDKVRIKPGGKDVTNGVEMKTGWKYCSEGGSLWGTVSKIVKDWNTGSKYGLPAKVVKVVIVQGSTVIWQVQPQDVSPKTIKAKKKEEVTTKKPDPPKADPEVKKDPEPEVITEIQPKSDSIKGSTNTDYAPVSGASTWKEGRKVASKIYGDYGFSTKKGKSKAVKLYRKAKTKTKKSAMTTSSVESAVSMNTVNVEAEKILKGQKLNIGDTTHPENRVMHYNPDKKKLKNRLEYGLVTPTETEIRKVKFTSISDSPDKLNELYNGAKSVIQNAYGFPYQTSEADASNGREAQYDYQFINDDDRYKAINLETRLAKARLQLGLPVHGDQDLARSMKMYMYNRFKSPDPNMAHSRTFTHVFFTRPDCFLLDKVDGVVKPANQVEEHTDTAMLWRRQPELMKMLVDCNRCDDDNNFNFLLSNQVTSFQLGNEGLNVVNVGKSWGEHEMVYGEGYNGRTSGEFVCTFDEVNDLSIINLMKLWTTYIANVADGSWSPYYPSGTGKNKYCHVYDRALDYAASVYVFWVGPDGSDILYWTKYYGVFPSVNGADALSWVKNGSPNETPKLSITFKYCYKRDLNPMALLSFNQISGVEMSTKSVKYVEPFDHQVAGASRPFVGAPFVEINMNDPIYERDDVSYSSRASIRLRFKNPTLSDSKGKRRPSNLYMPHIVNTKEDAKELDENAQEEGMSIANMG